MKEATLMTQTTQPTAYPDVNAVLHELLSSVQAILGEYFVGLYLYGSLSSGDFNPGASDIDFIVVTTDDLPEEMIRLLSEMHVHLAADRHLKWATKLEGAYISRQAVRRYDATHPPYPFLNEDQFHLTQLGTDWIIQRHIIREQGVVIAGPEPKTLIDPVSAQDIRDAVLGIIRDWWQPMLDAPDFLQAGGGHQVFAILTMCRVLYTLHHGDVASKPVSARWALKKVDPRWVSLIEEALAWQNGMKFDKLNETVEFIRYTVACSQQVKQEKQ